MGLFGKSFEDQVTEAIEQIRGKGLAVRRLAATVEGKVVTLLGEADDPAVKGKVMAMFNELVETENTLNSIAIKRPPTEVKKSVEVAAPVAVEALPKVEVAASPGSVEANPPVTERLHEVMKGETLSAIAKKYYGNASKYGKIFEANRDQLTNPDLIKVGQKLRIPV